MVCFQFPFNLLPFSISDPSAKLITSPYLLILLKKSLSKATWINIVEQYVYMVWPRAKKNKSNARLSQSFEVDDFIVGVDSWFTTAQQSSQLRSLSRWRFLPAANHFSQPCSDSPACFKSGWELMRVYKSCMPSETVSSNYHWFCWKFEQILNSAYKSSRPNNG